MMFVGRILIILAAFIVIIRCQLFPLTEEVRCRTDFFCSAAPFTLTLEQCCVTPTARTYTVDGIEGCFTCIVYGWNTTQFVAKEREEPYQVEIELRKGRSGLVGALVYNVVLSGGGTAVRGVDFEFNETSVTLDRDGEIHLIPFRFILDGISREPNRTFSLEMNLRSGREPFGSIVFVQRIDMVIIDGDVPDVNISFETNKIEVQESETMEICVVASPPDFARSIPVNITFLNGTDTESNLGVIEISIDPTTAKGCFNFTTIDDNILELDRDLTLTLNTTDFNTFVVSNSSINVTLLDNDILIVGWTVEDIKVSEVSSDVTLCANITSGVLGHTIPPFDVVVVPGTALNGTDYLSNSDPPTILFTPEDQGPLCTQVTLLDDEIFESSEPEYFTVELVFQGQNPAVVVDPTLVMVSIEENDMITIGFSAQEISVDEDEGNLTVCITKDRVSTIEIDVTIASKGGTASNGSDYRAIESVVTLLPGLSMTCFTSDDAIIDDNRALEMREDFFLEIVAVQPLDLVLINNEALTVFIMDNDDLMLGFVGERTEVMEGVGNISICVNVSTEDFEGPVEVLVEYTSISAQEGSDYVVNDESLEFSPSMLQDCISVGISNDDIYETSESLTINFRPSDRLQFDQSTFTVVITDDDALIIGFERTEYPVEEGDGEVELCAIIQGDIGSDIGELNFVSFPMGSATLGTDYDDQFSPTSFTLMSGVSNQLCVKVDIIDDSEIESFTEEENFFITMNISPLLLDRITLMPATTEVLITDNDAVTVGFGASSVTVNESSGEFMMCVRKDITPSPITVFISPMDGTAKAISEQQSDKTCEALAALIDGRRVEDTGDNCTINDDCTSFTCTGVVDSSNDPPVVAVSTYTFLPCEESVSFSILGTVNTIPVPVIEARVNSSTSVTFNPSSLGVIHITLEETDSGVIFGAVIDGTPSSPPNATLFPETEIPLRCLGDYLPSEIPSNLTLAPEDTSVCFTSRSITSDFIALEEDISFFLTITSTNPSDPQRVILGTDVTEIIIQDDDALVIGFQELTYDFAEPDPGTSQVTEEVCIEVTEGRIGTDLTIIVTWTPVSASLGTDYSTPNTRYSLSPGDESHCVDVNILGDIFFEQIENFQGQLSGFEVEGRVVNDVVGVRLEPDTTDIQITDNDAITVGFESSSYTFQEPEFQSFTTEQVCLELLAGRLDETYRFMVQWNPITASEGVLEDYSTQSNVYEFAAGVQRACINVLIQRDNIFEVTEEFNGQIVSIQLPDGRTVPSAVGIDILPSETRVFIESNDDLTLGFEMESYTYSEPPSSSSQILRQICITVTQGTVGTSILVRPSWTAGTATRNTDYADPTSVFQLDRGQTRQCVDFILFNDNLFEFPEDFSGQIDRVTDLFDNTIPESDMLRIDVRNTEIEITDNDDVTLGFERSEYTTNEPESGILELEVCLEVTSGGIGRELIIVPDFNPDTAREGIPLNNGDYLPEDDIRFVFNINDRRACQTIFIFDDDRFELTEEFNGVIEGIINSEGTQVPSIPGVTIVPSETRIIILDNDAVTIGFGASSVTVSEDSGEFMMCVRKDITAIPITVFMSPTDGTARALSEQQSDKTCEALAALIDGRRVEDTGDNCTINDDCTSFTCTGVVDSSNDPPVVAVSTYTFLPCEESVSFSILGTVNTIPVPVIKARVNSSTSVTFNPSSLGVIHITLEETDSGVIFGAVIDGTPSSPPNATLFPETEIPLRCIRSGDYLPSEIPSNLTLSPEDTSVCFTSRSITSDFIALEEDISFFLTITATNPSDPQRVILETAVTEIIIQDDDVVAVEFGRSSIRVNESSGEFSMCVVKNLVTAGPLEVFISSVNGTAIGYTQPQADQTGDYLPSEIPSSVTIQAEDTIMCFTSPSIVDDSLALEDDINFFLVITEPSDPGVIVSGIDQVEVVIVDDDVVSIGFGSSSVTVNENSGEFTFCVVKDLVTAVPIVLLLSLMGGSIEDYKPSEIPLTLTIASSETSVCFTSPAIIDDSLALENVSFSIVISDTVPNIRDTRITLDIAEVEIIIIDDDSVRVGFGAPSVTVSEGSGEFMMCVRKNITASPITVFMSPMDGTAKAISEQQSNQTCEALAALIDGRRVEDTGDNCTINDDCTSFTCTGVVDSSNDPPVVAVSTYTFLPCEESVSFSILGTVNTIPVPVIEARVNSSTSVTFNPSSLGVIHITLEETDSGVIFGAIIDGTPSSPPNATLFPETEIPLQCLGDYSPSKIPSNLTLAPEDTSLCFTSRSIVDDSITDEEDISFFLTITATNPSDPQRVILETDVTEIIIQDDDVGTSVNDTLTGDPVLTVPIRVSQAQLDTLNTDKLSLCYEIHGLSDAWFNFVSDQCISVNAHYSFLSSHHNIVDEVGIRGIDADGKCVDINIKVQGCEASVDGVVIDDRYASADISVRKYSSRVRVSVPNCAELTLVMWLICENRGLDDGEDGIVSGDMIKFVVMRGLNYGHRDAHGLIGQFWNVPVSIEPYTGVNVDGERVSDVYVVNVTTSSNKRSYAGFFGHYKWEGDIGPCLYAGDSQSGSSYEIAEPNDGVIEGVYTDYKMEGPFGEDGYKFGRFEGSNCNI